MSSRGLNYKAKEFHPDHSSKRESAPGKGRDISSRARTQSARRDPHAEIANNYKSRGLGFPSLAKALQEKYGMSSDAARQVARDYMLYEQEF